MHWWTVRQLKSKNPDKRQQAIDKLVSAQAFELLIAVLKNSNPNQLVEDSSNRYSGYSFSRKEREPNLQEQIIDKLVSVRAIGPLIAVLKDSDPNLQSAAARSLGAIGDPKALEPLMAALSDAKSSIKVLEELRRDTWAVGPLLDELEQLDIANSALIAMGQIDPKWAANESAIEDTGDLSYVEHLVNRLMKFDRPNRLWRDPEIYQIAEGLVNMGDASARPLAEALQRVTEPDVGEAIVDALVKIGHKPLLAAAFMNKDRYGHTVSYAAKTLSQLDSSWAKSEIAKTAFPDFVKALKIADPDIRIVAAKALGEIGNAEAIGPLAEAITFEGNKRDDYLSKGILQRCAEEALNKIDPDWTKSKAIRELVPTLINIISVTKRDDVAWDIMPEAIYLLGRIGDARAIAPSDQSVIYAAAASIAEGDFLDGLPAVFRSREQRRCGHVDGTGSQRQSDQAQHRALLQPARRLPIRMRLWRKQLLRQSRLVRQRHRALQRGPDQSEHSLRRRH
jgi:HEAT repeat protein